MFGRGYKSLLLESYAKKHTLVKVSIRHVYTHKSKKVHIVCFMNETLCLLII